MPEIPDIEAYLVALRARLSGHTLRTIRLSRIGKRIVFEFEGELFLVLHLMRLGRLHWRDTGARIGTSALMSLEFEHGVLTLTESGRKHSASLHLVRGRDALVTFDRGGLDVGSATLEAFTQTLQRENHTLKRALTDPRIFSGIGNAFSDEILHRARLSPLKHTTAMSETEIARLYDATRAILDEWTTRLVAEASEKFPEKVTAFKPGMAVHGRFREPCPICGSAI